MPQSLCASGRKYKCVDDSQSGEHTKCIVDLELRGWMDASIEEGKRKSFAANPLK